MDRFRSTKLISFLNCSIKVSREQERNIQEVYFRNQPFNPESLLQFMTPNPEPYRPVTNLPLKTLSKEHCALGGIFIISVGNLKLLH